MGARASSQPRQILGGQIGCCGKRGSLHIACRNERLNQYLEQLGKQSKVFDSAWLYREDILKDDEASKKRYHMMPRAESAQYVLIFQRNEIGEGRTNSRPTRRYLRIDWNRDGLAFFEVDSRLPDPMLVCSKDFEPPLTPSELLRELTKVENITFDADSWNSSAFSFHIIDQAKGTVYNYR